MVDLALFCARFFGPGLDFSDYTITITQASLGNYYLYNVLGIAFGLN